MAVVVAVIAGLLAGALNAVAGGGTFLSFPALVWIGVPPVMANATATLSALPGYLGSAWAYRHQVRSGSGPLQLKEMLLAAVAGGFVGALLLLITSQELFVFIVPWLLLFATIAFAVGPVVVRWQVSQGRSFRRPAALALLVSVTVYGGYFNGGLGILLLALFGLIGFTNLHHMNGLKNLMSAVLSIVSVATYIVAGLIDWPSAIILGCATAVGGIVGARLAQRVTNVAILRWFIVLVGLCMTIVFFVA